MRKLFWMINAICTIKMSLNHFFDSVFDVSVHSPNL